MLLVLSISRLFYCPIFRTVKKKPAKVEIVELEAPEHPEKLLQQVIRTKKPRSGFEKPIDLFSATKKFQAF